MDAEELSRRFSEYIMRLWLKGNPVKWESIRNKNNQKQLAKEPLWHEQPELFEVILKALLRTISMEFARINRAPLSTAPK